MNKQFSFLSGLPRTGSTLLCSILSQNPKIHAEGHSHVCEMIRQVYYGSRNDRLDNWKEYILVSQKQKSIEDVLRMVPYVYYADVNKSIIIDKDRNWTLPDNLDLIKLYVEKNPKIIVLVRPVEEIISSTINLRLKNNFQEDSLYDNILTHNDPTLSSIDGVIWAKENNTGEFLFIHYDDLVFDTKKTIKKIYDFCEWSTYEHDLGNIIRPFEQNDEVYGLMGLHDVRKTVYKQKYHIDLPKNILKKCRYFNSLIFED